MIQIKPLVSEDWQILKSIRLKALADAPQAFTTTLQQAQARTDTDWQEAAARSENNASQMTRIAFWEGNPCGMLGGHLSELGKEVKVADVVAVWVTPEQRGCGVGEALMASAIQWATGLGVSIISLRVNEDNSRAIAFYQKVGFVATGQQQLCEADLSENELQMVRRLDQQAV